LLVGEKIWISSRPTSWSTLRTKGEYWPKRHGPPAVGMKKALRERSKPGCSAKRRNVPSVTISG
jgi:hypothetical protein